MTKNIYHGMGNFVCVTEVAYSISVIFAGNLRRKKKNNNDNIIMFNYFTNEGYLMTFKK